ncbi:MAG: chalcone isomerase family protein [Proteobacteria bacterium]|nr:chalcone isomerase family protein [Pseudomonadota bacterium]
MKRTLILLWLLLSAVALAEEVEGVQLPDSLTFGDQTLILNGAGVRTKWMFSIYVGGLYLEQKSANATQIVDADEPMAIRMNMVYSRLTGDQMISAIMDGLDLATNGNTTQFDDELDLLTTSLERVGKNDVVDIFYLPGKGLGINLNGTFKGEVSNFEFKKAVFAIWLGNKPVHAKLKSQMLGR